MCYLIDYIVIDTNNLSWEIGVWVRFPSIILYVMFKCVCVCVFLLPEHQKSALITDELSAIIEHHMLATAESLMFFYIVWHSSAFIVTCLFNERIQCCSFSKWLIVVNFFKSFKLAGSGFFFISVCEFSHKLNWFKFIRLYIYGLRFCSLLCNSE